MPCIASCAKRDIEQFVIKLNNLIFNSPSLKPLWENIFVLTEIILCAVKTFSKYSAGPIKVRVIEGLGLAGKANNSSSPPPDTRVASGVTRPQLSDVSRLSHDEHYNIMRHRDMSLVAIL